MPGLTYGREETALLRKERLPRRTQLAPRRPSSPHSGECRICRSPLVCFGQVRTGPRSSHSRLLRLVLGEDPSGTVGCPPSLSRKGQEAGIPAFLVEDG